jgi:hypothetical protein
MTNPLNLRRNPTRVVLAFLVTALLPMAASSQPAAKIDVFEPLGFFVGSWGGTSEGKPGKGVYARTYALALNGKFIKVMNKSTYAPQEKNPKGEVHEDWGMLSYDKARRRFVLRQFHVEGFVNQYVAESTDDPKVLRFVSESIENIPAGFRARETYRIVGPEEFVETFELAEPGKDFEIYSEARLTRVR